MNEKILIPLSIIFAGLLVGFGLWWGQNKEVEQSNNQQNFIKEIRRDFQIEDTLTIYPLDLVNKETDLILGNPEAKVFVIVYTDLKCPACIRYHQHPERRALEKKYKDNDKVAFVLRHFPLKYIHPNSFQTAVAVECVHKILGTESAFKYIDKIFTNDIFKLAIEFGITSEEFTTCLQSEKINKSVELDFQNALKSGITATPSIFIQRKSDGKSFTMKEKMWDSRVVSMIIDHFLSQ